MYCPNCDIDQPANLVDKPETYEVRGDSFSVVAKVYICAHCKQGISNEDIDDKTLDSIYAEYRKQHHLLSPEQIKGIRNLYGLSQRSFSKLLEWGEATVARYEGGSIQDSVHNEVLEFIQNPKNMKILYEKNKHFLTNEESKKVSNKIQALSSENNASKLFDTLEEYLNDSKNIDEYSGYRKIDLNKIKNAILFITSLTKKEFKTKLNKLLWYSDFLYFRTNSISITGATYLHWQYGPVPSDYEMILSLMILEGSIKKETIVYDEQKGIIGEEISALVSCDQSVFEKSELAAMTYVSQYFEKFNSTKIKNYSHDEKAYKNTALKEKISYRLSEELSLSLPN